MRTIISLVLIAVMIGSLWYGLLGWVASMDGGGGEQGLWPLTVGLLGSLIAIGGLGILITTGRK